MKLTVDDECWLWAGYVAPNGYGQTSWKEDGGHVYIHRFMYEQFVGEIPAGNVVDHICNVRSCINPDHLQVLTQSENMSKKYLQTTMCRKGHEFNAANTIINPTINGSWRPIRRCRSCYNARMRNYQKKRKGYADHAVETILEAHQ